MGLQEMKLSSLANDGMIACGGRFPFHCTRAFVAMAIIVCGGALALADEWQNLDPGNPPQGRSRGTAVYDRMTNRMIIFGGQGGGPSQTGAPVFNDTWVLTNANGQDAAPPAWTLLDPLGPKPAVRWKHSAVYDVDSNRMVVYGGHPSIGNCGPVHSDLWVLIDANGIGNPQWQQLFPVGPSPGPKMSHLAGYDPGTNRMVVFQGQSSSCVAGPNTLWVLEHANGLGPTPVWTQLFPTGGPLPSNSAAIGGYDPMTNRLIAWFSSPSALQIWVLENANGVGGAPHWEQLMTVGTTPERSGSSAAYNPATNEPLVFGGELQVPPQTSLSDVFLLSNANGLGGPAEWTQLSPDPDPVDGFPPGRADSPQIAVDPFTGRLMVHGGHEHEPGTGFDPPFNDAWVLIPSVATVEVDIDIKPGSDPNSINLRAQGVLPVAVFTTEDFDVLEIDEETVLFGDPDLIDSGEGIPVSPIRSSLEDVDGDGVDDRVLFFSIADIAEFNALDKMSAIGVLVGATFDGARIVGDDTVRIVPPR